MTALQAHVGFRTAPTTVAVDAWRVKLFCQAIGETDPIHWDAEAAAAAGYRACPVPPTFLKALEGEHFSSARLLERMGVPLTGVLHAEQAFDLQAPVHVGDPVEISRHVASIQDKKNGAMTLVVVDTDYRVGGRTVGHSRQTILARHPAPAA